MKSPIIKYLISLSSASFLIVILGCIGPQNGIKKFQDSFISKQINLLSIKSMSATIPSPIPILPSTIPTSPVLETPKADNSVTKVPVVTPSQGINQYKLKSWTEKDAALAVDEGQLLSKDVLFNPDPTRYFITILREALYRFPNSQYNDQWTEKLIKPYIDGAADDGWYFNFPQHSIKPLLSLMEKDLNSGQLKNEDIKNWLENNSVIVYTGPDIANNLYGDHLPVTVYSVGAWDGIIQATILIKGNQVGNYQVSGLKGDTWEKLTKVELEVSIHDTNHNGIPEIIREEKFADNTFNDSYLSSLSIYEWDGQKFNDLASNLQPVLVNSNNKDLETWSFSTQMNGLTTIIANKRTPLENECPMYSYHTEYVWNGNYFLNNGEIIDPLPNNISAYCSILWAWQAGIDHPEGIKIVNNNMINWPTSMDGYWGRASKDYFHLWLAESQASRGKKDETVKELNQIIDYPLDVNPNIVPIMAKYFRDSYQASGPLTACIDLDNWILRKRITTLGDPNKYSDDDWITLLKDWGVGDKDWNFIRPCDIAAVAKLEFSRQNFHDEKELVYWLSNSGFNGKVLAITDLNGDGFQDWIIAFPYQELSGTKIQIWALIQQSNNLIPVLVMSGYNDQFPGSLIKINNIDKNTPIFLFHDLSQIFTFRIENFKSNFIPIVDFLNDPYTEREITQVTQNDSKLDVVFQGKINGKIISTEFHDLEYIWNNTTMRFGDAQTKPEDLVQKLTHAEEFLLVQNNPDTTVQVLRPIYDMNLNKQLISRGMDTEYVCSTSSYYSYLLGLAYEIKGDSKNAIQVYWKLWQSCPKSPYALIVQHKLELIP